MMLFYIPKIGIWFAKVGIRTQLYFQGEAEWGDSQEKGGGHCQLKKTSWTELGQA